MDFEIEIDEQDWNRSRLLLLRREESRDRMKRRLASDLSDGIGQGDFLWTDFDAVLGIATVGDSAGAHECVETFAFEFLAGFVEVEVVRLSDGLWADEVVVLLELWTGFEAAATGHTA